MDVYKEGPVTQSVITHNAAYQVNDLDAYDSDSDEISTAKAVLMANFSSYESDVLFEVPISNNTYNDMLNQSVQEMQYSEPSHFVEHPENEIHSDSNIILYSQYLIESQNAAVQDTNSSTQQDALLLYVFEQLLNQVTNCNKVNNDNLIANESLSAELERYKERVKLLEERQNVDLSTQEKLIIDDIIQEKNAQFADFEKEINNLKQNLFEQSKEKKLLTKTFNVYKNESKEKEAKNIDTEIALEKKVKELDNIICKIGQSVQTVHMLTKPQIFYDNNLKQALGFQNPFYLKKAQQIRPISYDGNVIAKETNVILIVDSEETLMLEEESRSKMFLKQSDPIVLKKKVNIKPISYADLNRLFEDFGKRFVPQQELSNEQAFWLQTLHPNTNQSASLPVKIKAPQELPKMEAAVQKYYVDKQCFEIQKKQFLIENDRLLDQIIFQDIVNIVMTSFVDENTSVKVNSSVVMNDSMNYVDMCNKCLELEAELIKQLNMVEKDELRVLLCRKKFQDEVNNAAGTQLRSIPMMRNSSSFVSSSTIISVPYELNIIDVVATFMERIVNNALRDPFCQKGSSKKTPHDVPIQVFEEDGISLIALFIGKPVMLDSYTSSMCNISWGRSSFAQCLIEVNLEADLVDVVTISFPSLFRDGFTKETIHVEYEWRPPRCDIYLSPMSTTTALKKGATYVGNTSQSSSMLKTTGNLSKRDNLSMSSSFSALNNEEEDDDGDIENVHDESANLIHNTNAGGSSSFMAAAG
ncbi:hypothetical protein Tco_0053948 [Tanacetum coccineum]